jgi:hypothetical protein
MASNVALGSFVGLALLFSASAACERSSPTIPSADLPQPVSPASPTLLLPSAPPTSSRDPFDGHYAMTLDVGAECSALPSNERTRTYSATISSIDEAKYIVTLTEGRFLSGLICDIARGVGCNQFFASRQGNETKFELVNDNDDGHGGHIVEQLSDGTWIEVIGDAIGQFRGDTIEARGSASVWYCPRPSGYPFPCGSYTGCKSSNMRLAFNRK